MMMEALINGRMNAYYSPTKTGIRSAERGGFFLNPTDVFEWGSLPIPLPDSIRGRVLKVFPWQMADLRPGPIKVLLVKREKRSLQRSLETYVNFSTSLVGSVNPAITYALKLVRSNDMDELWRGFETSLKHEPYISDVITLDYDEVCREPRKAFDRLYEHGWPLNPRKASKVPDPAWREKKKKKKRS